MTAPRVAVPATTKRPWRCGWGFHKWTVWSDPVPGIGQVLNFAPERIDVQQRQCLRCNEVELRRAQ